MNKRAQRAHKHAQKNLKRKLLAKARLRDEGLRKLDWHRSNQETLLKASYEERAAYIPSPEEEMALREEGLFDEKMVEFFNHPNGLFFREKLVRENREKGFIPFFYSSQKDEGLVL